MEYGLKFAIPLAHEDAMFKTFHALVTSDLSRKSLLGSFGNLLLGLLLEIPKFFELHRHFVNQLGLSLMIPCPVADPIPSSPSPLRPHP
uniref:Uncharacterized protein n=1 Tax=Cannabis sativa TaxID=3483 RepID=A0A803PIT7_CANSA